MSEAATKLGLPAPGDVIAGKYRILRSIGEGGMGHVFEASHVRMGQRVAIKVLKPSASQSAEVMTRFDREARAAGRLRGRHVARVLDVDLTPGHLPYLVMEFLDGHDLQTELEGRRAFPLEEAVDYVLQACTGIAEAHDIGIVHRDLKPSNLFLCDEGDRRIVRILDFGISKILDEASKLTSTELTIGTPLYMSPEQVRSARTVDARTDVWALGIILFELLTGRPPWVGSGPSVAAAIVTDPVPPLAELGTYVPAEVEAILHKALAKNAAERYPDVRALASALLPFCDSPNSLGRASLESALRAAHSGVSLVSTGMRASSSLGNAPTVLSLLPDSGSGAELGQPASHRHKAGATTAGWSTASGKRATDRSRLLFGAALSAAVAAVAVLVSIVVVARSGGGGAKSEPSALAAPGTATSSLAPPTLPPPADPPLGSVAGAMPSGSASVAVKAASAPPTRRPALVPPVHGAGPAAGSAGPPSTPPASTLPAPPAPPSSKPPLHM